VQEAKNKPIREADVRERMNKTGESAFYFETLDIQMDEDVFVPNGVLNQLRRDALAKLEAEMLSEFIREEKSYKEPVEKEENKEIEQANKEETEPEAEDFIDVPKTHWAYENVSEFSRRKIVLGYGNGYFGVDDSITYEHFGLLLERMFNYTAENIESTPAIREEVIVSVVKALNWDVANVDESIIEKTFSDCGGLRTENRKYIAKAIEKGLVIGYDGKLFADSNLTRAETVTLLARAEKM